MIPGADLLAMALSVIEPTAVQYYAFASRTPNAVGVQVATYAEPVTVKGSVQAVPLAEFEKFGLDLAREYVTMFAQFDMQNAGRDRANDYFVWRGQRWDIVQVTAWHAIDGWSEVLAIKAGPV